MKPMSISWAGDRAGSVSAEPGENHGLLSEEVEEPGRGAECHLATESRSLEGCMQETALITH